MLLGKVMSYVRYILHLHCNKHCGRELRVLQRILMELKEYLKHKIRRCGESTLDHNFFCLVCTDMGTVSTG